MTHAQVAGTFWLDRREMEEISCASEQVLALALQKLAGTLAKIKASVGRSCPLYAMCDVETERKVR